jgi:hypothetical protein
VRPKARALPPKGGKRGPTFIAKLMA